MKLSILICTIKSREDMLASLMKELGRQITGNTEVEILVERSEELSIGAKRNILLEKACGKYVAYIDDDDSIGSEYVSLIMEAIKKNPDCCSLKGLITTDGKDAKVFVHSMEHDAYFEKKMIYCRPPNHLNVIRASIAKQFKFPEKNFSEDTDWAMQICKSKLLKKEVWIEDTLYYYKFVSKKNIIKQEQS